MKSNRPITIALASVLVMSTAIPASALAQYRRSDPAPAQTYEQWLEQQDDYRREQQEYEAARREWQQRESAYQARQASYQSRREDYERRRAQWERDRFVQPSIVDQRTLIEVDLHLLAAAAAFESIELSPVAPLGVCSLMGHASQNKVLSALRGTEVVADPTNVMALECARRLRRDPETAVRLATSHRCVRAQPVPKQPGFTANFRMFSMVTAGLERQNHAFVVDALAEHVRVMLDALDRLEEAGFAFPERRITVLATVERTALGDRLAATCTGAAIERRTLEHPYYSGGLRFQITARSREGSGIPLIDGGAFDWVAKLTSNRRAVYVASAIGSQVAPLMFRDQGARP